MPCLIQLRIENVYDRIRKNKHTHKYPDRFRHMEEGESKRMGMHAEKKLNKILVSFNWIKIYMTTNKKKLKSHTHTHMHTQKNLNCVWKNFFESAVQMEGTLGWEIFKLDKSLIKIAKPYHTIVVFSSFTNDSCFWLIFFGVGDVVYCCCCYSFFHWGSMAIAAAKLENADADTCRCRCCCCFRWCCCPKNSYIGALVV